MQFVNERNALVDEALESLVFANEDLALLGNLRVIVSKHIAPHRVAVISGGGSGHEPSHAGFVGTLLDAAVCGDVFASPSVHQISACLEFLHEHHASGVLVIVKQYTGDRLNFGLAMERAPLQCEMVIVSDDTTPYKGNPRGLAGTLFVHKIASAMAKEGKSLAEIHSICQAVVSSAHTIGASLSECHIPGAPAKNTSRVAQGSIEIGMGIHNEAGGSIVAYSSCSVLLEDLSLKLTQATKSDSKLACIVNNLGSCSGLEMGCIVRAFLKTDLAKRVILLATGSLMTALDMHGFSISILELSNQDIVTALKLAVPSCPLQFHQVNTGQLSIAVPKKASITVGVEAVTTQNALVVAACEAIIKNESLLNELDKIVGDGDCGTTLANGANLALSSNMEADIFSNLALVCEQTGGSSGAVLSILFSAAASSIRMHGSSVVDALLFGTSRVIKYGGAPKADSRTFLDALIPALEALKSGKSLKEAALAARAGAERTKSLTSTFVGRSAYLNQEVLSGHADPGAVAVALVFESFLN